MIDVVLGYFLGFRRTPSPSPYATALLPLGQQTTDSVYAKPESIAPSRISYYASSQLTQVNPNHFYLMHKHTVLIKNKLVQLALICPFSFVCHNKQNNDIDLYAHSKVIFLLTLPYFSCWFASYCSILFSLPHIKNIIKYFPTNCSDMFVCHNLMYTLVWASSQQKHYTYVCVCIIKTWRHHSEV